MMNSCAAHFNRGTQEYFLDPRIPPESLEYADYTINVDVISVCQAYLHREVISTEESFVKYRMCGHKVTRE